MKTTKNEARELIKMTCYGPGGLPGIPGREGATGPTVGLVYTGDPDKVIVLSDSKNSDPGYKEYVDKTFDIE